MFFEGNVSSHLDNYIVRFKGLRLGKHLFEFTVDNRFFEHFPDSEIKNGRLAISLTLNKHTTMLEFNISITGEVEVNCDRCLEPFMIPLESSSDLVVKFGEVAQTDNDELWVVNENENEINFAQYFYESICLSLPIQRFHGILGTSENDCDPEMLKRINLSEKKKKQVDPRWQKLIDLNKN